MRKLFIVFLFTFLFFTFFAILPPKSLAADVTCRTCQTGYSLQTVLPAGVITCVNNSNQKLTQAPGTIACAYGSSCSGGQGGCQCLTCRPGATLKSDNPPQNTRFVCSDGNGFLSTSACSQGQTCSTTGQGCQSNCSVGSGGSCDMTGNTPCCIAGLVCKGGSVASSPNPAVSGSCQAPVCSEQNGSCISDSDCCNTNLKCKSVPFGTVTRLQCASACPNGTAYAQTATGIYGCITVNSEGVAPICSAKNSNGTCAQVVTGLGLTIGTNPQGLIQSLFGIILSISGGIALLLIIVSGYRLLASQGNPEAVKGAREQLTAAIGGLLFIILALVILQIIGVNILHIPRFK